MKMYFWERLAIFLKGFTRGFCQKLQISWKFDFGLSSLQLFFVNILDKKEGF